MISLCFVLGTMKEYAKKFYKSKAWQRCRQAYITSQGGLCELCRAEGKVELGEIVHHKVHITPENIHIPEIILSFDNMQLLCRRHHAEMHGTVRRFKVDDYGRVSPIY